MSDGNGGSPPRTGEEPPVERTGPAKAASPRAKAAGRKAAGTAKATGAGKAGAPPKGAATAVKKAAKKTTKKATKAAVTRTRVPAKKAGAAKTIGATTNASGAEKADALEQAATVPPPPAEDLPDDAARDPPLPSLDDSAPPPPPPPPPQAAPPPPPPPRAAPPPPRGGGWPPPPPGGPPSPPPRWGPQGHAPAPSRGLDGLAIAALVLGVVSIPLFVLFVPAILAIVFGAISRKNLGADDTKTGAGMATAGLVLGILSLIGAVVFLVATIAADDDGYTGDSMRYSLLQPGDCYEDPGPTAGEVVLEPCSDEHDREAFAVFDHPAPDDESFPGRETLRLYADDECTARFPAYVGQSYEESDLEVVFILPARDAWDEAGFRRIVCGVASADDEPLIGSVRDSAS